MNPITYKLFDEADQALISYFVSLLENEVTHDSEDGPYLETIPHNVLEFGSSQKRIVTVIGTQIDRAAQHDYVQKKNRQPLHELHLKEHGNFVTLEQYHTIGVLFGRWSHTIVDSVIQKDLMFLQ